MGIGKRALDLIGASLVLTLASPLLVLGALAVLLGSGRPIFFGHRRLGRDGIPFRCWKLRTMRVGAEAELEREKTLNEQYRGNGFKIATGVDPRVTRVGGWLRRSYVDEIPQLFNVLNGSMSLVGPRPRRRGRARVLRRGRRGAAASAARRLRGVDEPWKGQTALPREGGPGARVPPAPFPHEGSRDSRPLHPRGLQRSGGPIDPCLPTPLRRKACAGYS